MDKRQICFSNGYQLYLSQVVVSLMLQLQKSLAEALTMFSSLDESQTQQNVDGQRHCILIAASNPYPLPTPVYHPHMQNVEQSGNIKAHTANRLFDAETAAKEFPQCSVSLSVICPKQLPQLRGIYNAGKRDPQTADPPIDTSKNPNFLVLISENFIEACAAFNRTGMGSSALNQSLVEMDMSSVVSVSVPAATFNPAGRLIEAETGRTCIYYQTTGIQDCFSF